MNSGLRDLVDQPLRYVTRYALENIDEQHALNKFNARLNFLRRYG